MKVDFVLPCLLSIFMLDKLNYHYLKYINFVSCLYNSISILFSRDCGTHFKMFKYNFVFFLSFRLLFEIKIWVFRWSDITLFVTGLFSHLYSPMARHFINFFPCSFLFSFFFFVVLHWKASFTCHF